MRVTSDAALMQSLRAVGAAFLLLGLTSCATESSRAVAPRTVETAQAAYQGPRLPVSLGNFRNRSDYRRGAFSEGADRLGGQARTILQTHLEQTNRFVVLDRDNLDELAFEADLLGVEQDLAGAEAAIVGAVTEFGRRETGDRQLFGILGRGKQQLAFAKVALNVVDTRTGAVVHSVQGAGEYLLENREILGTGGTAGYDATLNGKVLDLAVTEAVDQLVRDLDGGLWRVGS